LNSDTTVISSDRLDLVPLAPNILRFSLSRDELSVERLLGLSVPPYWYEEGNFIRFRLQQLTEDPTYLPWSVRAISLRAGRQMVGYTGFHTKPAHPYLKPHAANGVEFGFEVFPPYRRQGYAREACNAVMRWAHDHHKVTEFIVSISPDNIPSRRLAQSLGFERVGSHIDEEDGLEDIFRLTYRPSDAAK
jgi:RimJ/RimL family protein N-acetyltransferase